MKSPLVSFDPGAEGIKSWKHAEYFPGWQLRSWDIRGAEVASQPGVSTSAMSEEVKRETRELFSIAKNAPLTYPFS